MAAIKKGGSTLFEIPSMEEVVAFVSRQKPEWPEKFITYYAEKFWYHYDSSGWRLSNGNKIKNWQSCFHANWKRLRYKEDTDMLLKYEQERRVVGEKAKMKELRYIVYQEKLEGVAVTPEYMENLLREFERRYDKIPNDALSAVYPWMKEHKYIFLTKDETESIKATYRADQKNGMAACVKASLSKMIARGESFLRRRNVQ